MKEEDKPIRTTLYLPKSLWKEVRLLAVETDTTATDIVVKALAQYLAKKGGK
jgi:hypothetical protein